MKSLLLSCAASACLIATSLAEDVRLIGVAEIPSNLPDRSGQEGTLEGGIPANQWGGFGSGIAYLGQGNRYAVISARGPADGATAYRCRFHVIDISLGDLNSGSIDVKLLETHLLSDQNGRPLIGSLSALRDSGNQRGYRFDPEAIRATPRGTLLISEEYGPSIGEFTRDGRLVREFSVPNRFQIRHSSTDPNLELPPANTSGRQPNRGLECLTISPDGSRIYALLQSPLIQDGALDEMNKRVGTNVRLLEITVSTGATREFLYPLDAPTNGCNEIEYLSPGRLLVIERDSKLGADASVKQIVEINISKATDISHLESLPSTTVPAGVVPVSKSVFLNLLEDRWKLAGPHFPEKIEGIAMGPRLKDGSRVLLISSDNDFLPAPSYIYAFAIRD